MNSHRARAQGGGWRVKRVPVLLGEGGRVDAGRRRVGSRAWSQGGGWHTGWEPRFCALRLCQVFNSLDSRLLICADGGDLGRAGL